VIAPAIPTTEPALKASGWVEPATTGVPVVNVVSTNGLATPSAAAQGAVDSAAPFGIGNGSLTSTSNMTESDALNMLNAGAEQASESSKEGAEIAAEVNKGELAQKHEAFAEEENKALISGVPTARMTSARSAM